MRLQYSGKIGRKGVKPSTAEEIEEEEEEVEKEEEEEEEGAAAAAREVAMSECTRRFKTAVSEAGYLITSGKITVCNSDGVRVRRLAQVRKIVKWKKS